jgi:hypothetical protein
MKRLLLKRNGSMTMTPLQKSLSLIRELFPVEEKVGDALVKRFLSELREAGVKTSQSEGRTGNHFRLEQGKAGVEVSLHGSGVVEMEGWWSVGVNYTNKVEKWGGHWGVVFLTPEKRFWVDGCNFFRIAGDETEIGRHHVQLADLEKSPSYAITFSSVQEFLLISGLR